MQLQKEVHTSRIEGETLKTPTVTFGTSKIVCDCTLQFLAVSEY